MIQPLWCSNEAKEVSCLSCANLQFKGTVKLLQTSRPWKGIEDGKETVKPHGEPPAAGVKHPKHATKQRASATMLAAWVVAERTHCSNEPQIQAHFSLSKRGCQARFPVRLLFCSFFAATVGDQLILVVFIDLDFGLEGLHAGCVLAAGSATAAACGRQS